MEGDDSIVKLQYLGNYSKSDNVQINSVGVMQLSWIKLKYIKFLIRGNYSIFGKQIFKVMVDGKIVLFGAKKKSDNTFDVYTINEKDYSLILRKDEKYLKSTRDYQEFF